MLDDDHGPAYSSGHKRLTYTFNRTLQRVGKMQGGSAASQDAILFEWL
jgi:hypothetical protein